MVTKKEIVIGTLTGVLGNILYAFLVWSLKPKNVSSSMEGFQCCLHLYE